MDLLLEYKSVKSIPKLSLAGLPESMPGSQPQPGIIQGGCSFFDRCNFSEEKCKNNSPQLEFIKELNTSVRCFNYKKLLKEDLKSKMILQIHDELLFEFPENEEDRLISIVVNSMEKAMRLKVPIIVDYGVGNNWYEAH